MGFESSKTMLYMNILTYIDVLVNIKASALIYIDKGVIIFDSLRNAPYFIKLKRGPSRYKKNPFDLSICKPIICRINKNSL